MFKIGSAYFVVDTAENRIASRALYSRREGERTRDLKVTQDAMLAHASSKQMQDLINQAINPEPGAVNAVQTPPQAR